MTRRAFGVSVYERLPDPLPLAGSVLGRHDTARSSEPVVLSLDETLRVRTPEPASIPTSIRLQGNAASAREPLRAGKMG
jgi:hypothetical protein